jgi:Na+/H+-translocating membrane pyrophosphatase
MLPYWFSAMTMKAVGDAANEMIAEIARQFENP